MDSEQAFEEEVRQALRRIEAPEHFAERLQARMAARAGEPATVWARWLAMTRSWRFAAMNRSWRFAGMAAVMLVLLAAGVGTQQHIQQRRAQVAAARFDRALQVTGHALDHITTQLRGGQVGTISQALDTVSEEKR